MTPLMSLWLPILVSAAIVFVASSIIHMATKWHADDYPKLESQDKVMDALRPFGMTPGDYMIPRPNDMKDMGTPEFQEKLKKGPVVVMTVMPNGMMDMGKSLGGWFAFCLVVNLFAGYVASASLGAGTTYLKVFQVVGTAAFMGYSFALWPMTIWYHRSMRITAKATIDGLLFGLLTAGTFGWLWPK